MSQSLVKMYIHIIYSTKHRQKLINKSIKSDLQSYLVGLNNKLGSYTYEVYAHNDHTHILCLLPKNISISEFMNKTKVQSSKWLKTKGLKTFAWQNGYGAFSVSPTKVESVRKYILNQEKHHKNISFKDEMREFFKYYDIDYDERYVWE